MSGLLAVLRPEPGNAATAARAEAAGYAVLRLPLFAVVPVAWTPPDPRDHDGLVLTSASTVRHAGTPIDRFGALPVIAVGEQTATAARSAGLEVAAVGTSDAGAVATLLAERGIARALHLGGQDHAAVVGVSRAVAVYASEPVEVAPGEVARIAGQTALLHSARAARRLAMLLDTAAIPREGIRIAAFSPAIAAAAGTGWQALAIAPTPSDAALFAAIDALGR